MRYLKGGNLQPSLFIPTGIKQKDGKILGIRVSDIKNYVDEEFFTILDMYYKTKQYGLPCGRGWYDEDAHIIDMLDACNEGFKQWR